MSRNFSQIGSLEDHVQIKEVHELWMRSRWVEESAEDALKQNFFWIWLWCCPSACAISSCRSPYRLRYCIGLGLFVPQQPSWLTPLSHPKVQILVGIEDAHLALQLWNNGQMYQSCWNLRAMRSQSRWSRKESMLDHGILASVGSQACFMAYRLHSFPRG
jgi:hypothetical protein